MLSSISNAVRYCGATAFALLAGGCATPFDGKYAFGEGWREARVTEVERGDSISQGATTDCRKFAPWQPGDFFARVEYRFSLRVKLTYIVRIRDGKEFKAGDLVYANVRDCGAALAGRGVP